MAKVTFTKIKPSIDNEIVKKTFINADGESIEYEVKYYLPIKEKIDLISNVINQSVDDNGFYNPIRVKLYMTLEVIYAYTNISFTAKQKEDPFKLYDLFISSGLFDEIVKCMSERDWCEIQDNVWHTIENVYKYKNSLMGILNTVVADYDNLNLDIATIQEQLADPNNIGFLKQVMEKMG